MIPLPSGAISVMEVLEDAGHEAFVVGGAVRDFLIGTDPKETADVDIATSAPVEETIRILDAAGMTAHPTGIEHGTVTAICDETAFEVTTFRIDGSYSDSRHPDEVRFTESIEEDLARRDFTINAMAYSPSRGLIDPFGGSDDLKCGTIRCVGDPAKRFSEDALRIMRGVRFSAKLGFHVESETALGMLRHRKLLRNISAERIGSELMGIMQGRAAGPALGAFAEVLEIPIPEIAPTVGMDQGSPNHSYSVWDHTLIAMEAQLSDDLATRLATFFHDLAKPLVDDPSRGVFRFDGHAEASGKLARKVLARLRTPNRIASEVSAIVAAHDHRIAPENASVRHWLGKLTPTVFFKVLDLKRADMIAHGSKAASWAYKIDEIADIGRQVIESGECYDLSGLEVRGDDLLERGIDPGPAVGRALRWLLLETIEGRVANERGALLDHLSELPGR